MAEQNSEKPSTKRLVLMSRDNVICTYDDDADEWVEEMSVPEWHEENIWGHTTWYASGPYVILAGHSDEEEARRVVMMNIREKTSKQLPDLPEPLQNPGIYVHKGFLYSFAGINRDESFNSKQVYRINMTEPEEWETLPEITGPYVNNCPVISSDDQHIYLFGADSKKTMLQIFDLQTMKWSVGADMPGKITGSLEASCIKRGEVFTLFTISDIMEYNSSTDTWAHLKHHKTVSTTATAVEYKEDILMCGVHKQNFLWRYDPTSEETWQETSITNILYGHIRRNNYFFVVDY